MNNELKIQIEQELIDNIKSIIVNARKKIAQKVNQALIFTYWGIGKVIVEHEKQKGIDNQSSRQFILALSKKLTKEIGRGSSPTSQHRVNLSVKKILRISMV